MRVPGKAGHKPGESRVPLPQTECQSASFLQLQAQVSHSRPSLSNGKEGFRGRQLLWLAFLELCPQSIHHITLAFKGSWTRRQAGSKEMMAWR